MLVNFVGVVVSFKDVEEVGFVGWDYHYMVFACFELAEEENLSPSHLHKSFDYYPDSYHTGVGSVTNQRCARL